MAWSEKDARDDTDYQKPRQLPPNGWAKPEQRAADAAIEALSMDTVKTADKDAERINVVNLTKFEKDMNEDRIAGIKEIVRALTYGEMMQVAELLAEFMPSGTVDKDSFKLILPPTLHAWATKAEG